MLTYSIQEYNGQKFIQCEVESTFPEVTSALRKAVARSGRPLPEPSVYRLPVPDGLPWQAHHIENLAICVASLQQMHVDRLANRDPDATDFELTELSGLIMHNFGKLPEGSFWQDYAGRIFHYSTRTTEELTEVAWIDALPIRHYFSMSAQAIPFITMAQNPDIVYRDPLDELEAFIDEEGGYLQ